MNLQEIADRTGLPLRNLRYVVDREIVRTVKIKQLEHERGRPRVFSDDVGVAIGCAAWLLESGLNRKAVEHCLESMAELNFRPQTPRKGLSLADIIRHRTAAVVQIGDGVNCRCIIESASPGWLASAC